MFDESGFVKKGKESVGVARQYCGTIDLLSAPLMIPLVAVISRASDEHPGVARLWPGGENKIGRRTSHQEEFKAIGAFLLPRAATGVSLVAV